MAQESLSHLQISGLLQDPPPVDHPLKSPKAHSRYLVRKNELKFNNMAIDWEQRQNVLKKSQPMANHSKIKKSRNKNLEFSFQIQKSQQQPCLTEGSQGPTLEMVTNRLQPVKPTSVAVARLINLKTEPGVH